MGDCFALYDDISFRQPEKNYCHCEPCYARRGNLLTLKNEANDYCCRLILFSGCLKTIFRLNCV
ncbi:MAG: hypothetical protein IJM09_01995 [Neisseriaceae bacterium]|nr:hypothetical protein [Neisseriaceae bacterium]